MTLPVKSGGGGGGLALSADQAETLKHIRYNADTDKVESDRAVRTTLDSISLGDLHVMSSGYQNIFYKNEDSKINWYPMWGGIDEQSVPANQGVAGTVPPSARTYSNNLVEIEANGTASVGGSTTYSHGNTLGLNASVFGIEFIVEEAVSTTDWLHYEIRSGTDNTGLIVFDQLVTGRSYSAGDRVIWWFDHPVEGHSGNDIFTELKIRKGDRDNAGTLLLVRRSVLASDAHYVMSKARTFQDETIALSSHLGVIELLIANQHDLDSIHVPSGEMIMWAFDGLANEGEFIEWA